jgi:hypothetical protein
MALMGVGAALLGAAIFGEACAATPGESTDVRPTPDADSGATPDADSGATPDADGGAPVVTPTQGRYPGYVPGSDWHLDADGDGVPTARDSCPSRYDPAQGDADQDGVGDACDPDSARPVLGGPIVDLGAENVTPYSAWLAFTATRTDPQGYGAEVQIAWSTRRSDLESSAAFAALPAKQRIVKTIRAFAGSPAEVPMIVEGLPPATTVYLTARNEGDSGAPGNILTITTQAAPSIVAAADRPTVLVRRADLDGFASRMQAGDSALLAWKTRIDAELARLGSPDTTTAQYCASAALLYHATGDASRLTRAKALHEAARRAWASTTLTGNAYRWANAMLGVCTDLLWNELSASEKSTAVATMLEDDEHNAFTAPPLFEDTDESDGTTRTLLIDGLVACRAPGLDAALSTRACAILEAGLRRTYGQLLVEARRDRGAFALSGGHIADGSDYGPKTARYWGQVLRALQVNGASSADYLPFASNLVRAFFVHGVTPSRKGFISWGDVTSAGNNLAVEPFSFALESDRQDALHWFAGILAAGGDTVGAERARRAMSLFTPQASELSFPSLLFGASAAPAADDDTNVWFDSGMGILYDRTGWSSSSSLVMAKATWGGVDHQQEDAGEWRLWRKGTWIVHPSVGYGGVAGTVAAHSTLPLTVIAERDAPREGQYVGAPSAPARITGVWSDRVVSITTMDMSGMYRSYYYTPRYYTNVRRTLVWWKATTNDEVVVADVVDEDRGAPQQKRWQLHFPTRPTVNGAAATVAVGSVSARVDALLPAGTVLAVRAPVTTAANSQEDVYTHRLVGTSTTPSPRFLSVVQAGESAAAMVAARAGVGEPCALVGTRATVVTSQATGRCELPDVPESIVLVGLAARARYDVRIEGAAVSWSPGAALEASEVGHLRLGVRDGVLTDLTRDAIAR